MIDLVFAVATVLLLIGYQVFLHMRLRRDPLFTVHALNKVAREAWVDTVMGHKGPDVLAVQTLRNSVMASSFMASTAILLMIGALTIAGTGDHPRNILHALNISGGTDEATLAWKVLCLLVDFFAAFFFFAMAVRFFNHVGYMVSIPRDRAQSPISTGLVIAYLNRAGTYYFLGIRAFFYSVPLVFWMFGPNFMLAATVLLIAVLYPLDRAPKAGIRPAESAAQTASVVIARAGEEPAHKAKR
jgi:uncharacterized membrane protein